MWAATTATLTWKPRSPAPATRKVLHTVLGPCTGCVTPCCNSTMRTLPLQR